MSTRRPVIALPCLRTSGGAARAARRSGILRASTGPLGTRVWVETGPDRALPVVWPSGYHARLDPLELLDEQNQVVAREGDKVILRGGIRPPDSSDEAIENLVPGLEKAFIVQGRVRTETEPNG
jgi:hypothetical protein